MENLLLPQERIDELFAENIKIIQSSQVFSFSLDAVLLADFTRPVKKGKMIDLCSGNGAVGLFLSRKSKASILQVEIQEKLANMNQRSIELNHLENQLEVLHSDLKLLPTHVKKDSIDSIVCNPPYFKKLPSSKKNPNPHLAIARHETHTNLSEIIQISSQLLKMNGRLTLVHRPERFLEILQLMESYRISPKRIRFVYPKMEKKANILLIEGLKDGCIDGLEILPPLFVYDENNEYLPEARKIIYGE